MKRRVERMKWKPASTLATAYGVKIPQAIEYVKKPHGMGALESDVEHPVVRTHVSGRKALWVSTFTVKSSRNR